MAIKPKSRHTSSLTTTEVPVVVEKVQPYNYKEIKIQSLIDSHFIYVGKITEKNYEWRGAGDVVFVDEQDAPDLLSKRIGERSCCGDGLKGNKVFEQVE